MLDQLDVILFESSIDDPDFFGTAVVRGDGRVILSMPSDQPADLRDTIARFLLGQVFDMPVPPLPEAFSVTEL